MLVLSRHPDETIVIPEAGVTFKIVSISGQKVRIAIDAPKAMSIHRGEVMEKILEEREARKERGEL